MSSACSGVTPGKEVKVYFENISATKLISAVYMLASTDKVEAAKELFSYMQDSERTDCVAAVPASFTLKDVQVTQSTLVIDLEGAYDSLPGNAKLLLAAALTKTMTQIDGITYLYLNVNGEKAKDASGADFGILRSALFVDIAADDPNNFVEETLSLYYSNADGSKLVLEKLPVSYRRGSSLERTVVEQLIRGPLSNSVDVKRTLPANETLLSVTVTDGICYINLSQDLQYEALGVFNYIPVYSIVNSLGKLSTVDRVQILVNGSAPAGYDLGDKVSLDTPLAPDYSYVQDNNSAQS